VWRPGGAPDDLGRVGLPEERALGRPGAVSERPAVRARSVPRAALPGSEAHFEGGTS